MLSGNRIYRLEISAGFGAEDLMGAVGGGLRTTVRSSASNRIAGQAKLVPMAAKGGMVATLGPVLALMALTTATEMAGGDAQGAKLTAIQEGVERIDAHIAMETDARLQTAEQAIRQAHAALLDGAVIPEGIGLGTAMSNLQVVRNMSTSLIAGWERVVADLPPGPTSGAGLRSALGKVGKVGRDRFASALRTAYLSITLDSRRIMLTASEAQLRNPGLPLVAFRQAVETDLAARTAELERLRSLLVRLSTLPLTLSSWSAGVLPHLIADGAAENARTQALFATLASTLNGANRASALPMVDNRIFVEAGLRPGGEVQLHRHPPQYSSVLGSNGESRRSERLRCHRFRHHPRERDVGRPPSRGPSTHSPTEPRTRPRDMARTDRDLRRERRPGHLRHQTEVGLRR